MPPYRTAVLSAARFLDRKDSEKEEGERLPPSTRRFHFHVDATILLRVIARGVNRGNRVLPQPDME
jgi:hypothetical protein